MGMCTSRMRTWGFFIAAFLALPVHGQCIAESGPGTAALVELYTSEGCSSCPPADRWLRGLRERHAPGTLVPATLYVHSWANREFSLSQKKLLPLQRLAFVFTP